MTYVNIGLYILLLSFNAYLSNRNSRNNNKNFIAVISALLLFSLMSGHRYAGPSDSGDFLQYLTDYNLQEMRNYGLHYLFFFLVKVGYFLGLNFYQWWALMTAITLFLLGRAIKKFDLDVNYSLVIFMSYYVFMFYAGLKFLYGFIFLFIGTGYLLRGKKRDKPRFVVSVLIASGIHFMYYPFLLLSLINIKSKNNKLVYWIVFVSLFFSIYVLLTGRNIPFLSKIVSLFEDNKIIYYLQSRTTNGFYIPVLMHLLTLVYSKVFNQIIQASEGPYIDANARKWSRLLYYSNLLQFVFYPFFMLALTFMRLVTAFSLITLVMSSRYIRYMKRNEKNRINMCALVLIIMFWIYNAFIVNHMDYVLIQFFDSYIMKLDF